MQQPKLSLRETFDRYVTAIQDSDLEGLFRTVTDDEAFLFLTADGRRQATVHLLYHAGTGSNCVVTLKESSVGAQTAVSAFLEVRGRGRSTDDGSFRYYAGPVRAEAAGTCVKWGGSAGGASYSSPFEHCD